MTNRVAQFLTDWPGEPEKPAITPSGSSGAEIVVRADSMEGAGLGDRRLISMVNVSLEQNMDDRFTQLVIERGDAVDDGPGPCPIRITLKKPTALAALISALLQLTVNRHGAAVLASIVPEDDDEPVPPRKRYDDDDDDDDDDQWKRTPVV